jgi:dTDP-4-amino-4,6-dideoxygalactose transaminase
MSSGTDAQLAILMALGIGPGDAVITTPYTFFATAGCVHRLGAETVFVDIEPDTLHISATQLEAYLKEQCTPNEEGVLCTPQGNRIRALIPVHLFGTCCDTDVLTSILAPWNILLIEDAAQAIGSDFLTKDGEVKRAGTLGDAAYFSFFPTKNLGAAGDAGMAVCQSEEFAAQLRLVRNHGMEQRYYHRMVGGNFRIDAIQAAVLQAKFPFIDEWNAGRRRNADLYRAALSDLSEFFTVPGEPWKEKGLVNHHTYHQYVGRAKDRDALLQHLAAQKIGHAIYYPVALHLQECFAYLGYTEGAFPEAEKACRETVALPIFPELREDEIAEVAAAIRGFYRG